MTTSVQTEVQRRRGGAPKKPRTVEGAWAQVAREILLEIAPTQPVWPSPTYRRDPIAFFREVLGVEPWSKQIQVIEAVRDHKRVAVRSGHKVSKSHTAAGIALWYFHSFEDARVIMTSTTARQVDQILWREAKMMHARSGRCVACKRLDEQKAARGEPRGPRPCPHSRLLDGAGEPLPELARTGLKSDDFRELVGFTAREAEAVQGVSGKNLLYIVDEASGVPQLIFDAIEGNRAGGARVLLLGNPTRNEGEHYEAFEGSLAGSYHGITISSEETPNAISGDDVIPGLATREWIEERKREWGETSSLYIIRVKGRHALREEGRVISVHAVKEAEERWADDIEAHRLAVGRLVIGVDPAGPGLFGDESGFAIRRGLKVLAIHSRPGLSEDAIVAMVAGFLREYSPDRAQETQPPLVVVDKGGAVGSKVFGRLASYLRDHPGAFALVGVDSSRKAERDPEHFDLVRDELWERGAQWLNEGGALPSDVKLAKDLHTAEWEGRTGSQKLHVTRKEDMRKKLGRSPDRGDAFLLSVWDPVDVSESVEEQLRARGEAPPAPGAPPIDAWNGAQVMNPYGGGLR